jgi:deoxyadenosine/deoxycytidine kinase
VEGPLGAGKTAFAEAWAERTGARRLELDPAANPFLPDAFAAPERKAFSAQMAFLLARHQQQLGLRQGELFARSTVVDYVFERDRVYAELLLSPAELALYDRIFHLLAPRAVAPDLLVALRAKPERLLERLRARDAPHERPISLGLLERLVEGYGALLGRWRASPVVAVDVSEVELAEHEDALDALIGEVLRVGAGLSPGDRLEMRPPRSP